MLEQISKTFKERQFPMEFPGHWVSNCWQPATKTNSQITSTNPSSSEVIVEFYSDPTTLKKAIDSSAGVALSFSKTSFSDRVTNLEKFRVLLLEHKEAAISAMEVEAGKAHWEAEADFGAAMRFLGFLVRDADKIHDAAMQGVRTGYPNEVDYHLQGIGTTMAYLPFSSPITSLAQYFGCCLLAGCPLTLVVSHHAALTGLLSAAIAEQLKLPPGVFNVAFCNFEMTRPLMSDRRIKAIIYTGSREHCDTIRKESFDTLDRQLILQSGGKNSTIIDKTADLTRAIEIVAMGAFKSAGQLCTATSRVFVHSSIIKPFCAELTSFCQKMPIGSTDKDIDRPLMGPLFSAKAVDKFLQFQTMAHRDAAEDLMWGKSISTDRGGFLVSPGLHVMKGFDPKSAYQTNVLLCPDVCIYGFDKFDEIVTWMNSCDTQFVTSFCGDRDQFDQIWPLLNSPNILFEQPTTEMEVSLPLSGRNQSGQHRVSGASLFSLLSLPQAVITKPIFDKEGLEWPKLND
jgi:acyl-CoA reductase-like NAD-dependent aldehyde dehydrogenase